MRSRGKVKKVDIRGRTDPAVNLLVLTFNYYGDRNKVAL